MPTNWYYVNTPSLLAPTKCPRETQALIKTVRMPALSSGRLSTNKCSRCKYCNVSQCRQADKTCSHIMTSLFNLYTLRVAWTIMLFWSHLSNKHVVIFRLLEKYFPLCLGLCMYFPLAYVCRNPNPSWFGYKTNHFLVKGSLLLALSEEV